MSCDVGMDRLALEWRFTNWVVGAVAQRDERELNVRKKKKRRRRESLLQFRRYRTKMYRNLRRIDLSRSLVELFSSRSLRVLRVLTSTRGHRLASRHSLHTHTYTYNTVERRIE